MRETNYKIIAVMASACFLFSISSHCHAQTVWTEDFESFSLGDLPSQDSTWSFSANPVLSSSSVEVVSGQELKISASATNNVGEAGNYAYKNLSNMSISGNTVTLSFTMLHAFTTAYQGKYCSIGFLSSTKGKMFAIDMYDGSTGAFLNGFPITLPAGNTYHDYSLVLDFELDTVNVTIGPVVYGTFALMGTEDWTPFDLTDESTYGLYWAGGIHYNNTPQTNYILVDDILISQDNILPPQWNETFQSFATGDILPQDLSWSLTSENANSPYAKVQDNVSRPWSIAGDLADGEKVLEVHCVRGRNTAWTRSTKTLPVIGDGQTTRIRVSAKIGTAYTGGTRIVKLNIGGNSGDIVLLTIHFNNDLYILTDSGDVTAGTNINDGNFHDYDFIMDFTTDTTEILFDGDSLGSFNMPTDFSSSDVQTLYAEVSSSGTFEEVLCFIDDIAVLPEPASTGPIQIGGCDMLSLVPGRSLFKSPNDHIRWNDAEISGIDGFLAVTELNRTSPLAVTNQNPGYLYALLWRWDFGILADDWSPIPSLHGWTLVNADAGDVLDFTAPMSPLPLYRRPISAGTHDVNVTEIIGQWVLVGFVEDPAAAGNTDLSTANLVNGQTMYNVFDPDQMVDVQSGDTILSTRLCQNSQPDQVIASNPFNAPQEPGRYWLELDFANGTRIVPLTVGLGPVDHRGWYGNEFFPICSYGGQGYKNSANPGISPDLTVLAQFELGYNTWFVTVNDTEGMMDTSLIDALGGRRLYKTDNYTRYYIREVADDTEAVEGVMWSLEHFDVTQGGSAGNVLGFYIEDEPPANSTEARMKLVEERFAVDYAGTDLRLLYCLNSGNLSYWQQAGTSSGSFRAYPFYKSDIGDIAAMQQAVQNTLIGGIDNWKTYQPDPNEPLWMTTQAFGDPTWAIPTTAQLRLQVNLELARGVKALTHFHWTWDWPLLGGIALWPYIPVDERYEELGLLHDKIKSLELHKWLWIMDVPQLDPNFDVQILRNAQGSEVAWITNLSWTSTSSGTVNLPGSAAPRQISLFPGDSEIVPLCPDLTADRNSDCSIDINDLAIIAQTWLDTTTFTDFSELSQQWMQSVTFP